MLLEIHIENFAIIDSLQVRFSEGLNVITGETGAGKSIMVDALIIALGGRASADFIRAGADRAVIELLFTLDDVESARQKAREYGFLDQAEEEQHELLIRREISRNGRNRLLVNGHPATNLMVSDLGDLLVDIHGQHEHQSILHSDYHIELLDLYGKLLPLRQDVAETYRKFRNVEQELKQVRDESQDRLQYQDLLRFQHEEISRAGLIAGEDDDLRHERTLMSGAEQLNSGASAMYDMLYNGRSTILEQFSDLLTRLRSLAEIDNTLETHVKRCESIQYELEDLAYSMRDYANSIEFDPYRLDAVEKRLHEINGLKRKYGNSIEEILNLHGEIEQKLQSFDDQEARIQDLEKTSAVLRQQLDQISRKLSAQRKVLAKSFEQNLMQELAMLSMEKTRFRVDFTAAGTERHPFTAGGIDRIEFLIAPNPGEPLKPFSKIASGGEISRVMLALKTLLGTADCIPVMVFDEIDTGIGGKTAEVVGKKLKQVSRSHQVICITHLPQIASKGTTHFHITKKADDTRTLTMIRNLSERERLEEIARMVGGEHITETTIKHAREMLGHPAVDKKRAESNDA
ncbi:DNA repair protein RecN [candidate division KSB3 bacterium]|uniref:DNA repair protein RecN n=1 Tax=candidate division KSB3 bacterium TaxID=2044937 RepID=A0A2G6E6H6_9BACT|nr:MAG: DNA repair protein RecN [candidate division KSB3 bacterium]PIE30113.1 MAG: DNA repair protein RecN [candidate division KSB3 bacterium]